MQLPFLSCCSEAACPSIARPPPGDLEHQMAEVFGGRGAPDQAIDYFRSPDSFVMMRNAVAAAAVDGDRILKQNMAQSAATSGLFLGDTSRPPRSLLEASSRRVAAHKLAAAEAAEREEQASGSKVCGAFTSAYVKALEEEDAKWAAGVAELFHREAKMVTHDKQMFHGLTAIIRRLNAGVEQLLNMAKDRSGDESGAQIEGASGMGNLEISGPEERGDGTWVTTYHCKWGIRKFKFQDEFTLQDRKIKRLKRSRL